MFNHGVAGSHIYLSHSRKVRNGVITGTDYLNNGCKVKSYFNFSN